MGRAQHDAPRDIALSELQRSRGWFPFVNQRLDSLFRGKNLAEWQKGYAVEGGNTLDSVGAACPHTLESQDL
jgi:hypothetical protein